MSKQRKISIALCFVIAVSLLAGAITCMPHLHAADPAAIQLNTTISNLGSFTSIILKGDANQDGKVTMEDYTLIAAQANTPGTITDPLALKAADVDGNNIVNLFDANTVKSLVDGNLSLPSSYFTFSATYTPAPDFKFRALSISAKSPTVSQFVMREASTVNGFKLFFNGNNVTITGPCSSVINLTVWDETIIPQVSLTFGNDGLGKINEWVLKGDVNRDQKVDGEDYVIIMNHINDVQHLTDDPLILDAADVNSSTSINSSDISVLDRLLSDKIPIPSEPFIFRVVDTPHPGYRVTSATITTPDEEITLTPDNTTSGGYTLYIGSDRLATVTGLSHATTDVQFTHEINPPVITLTFGSDDHGSIAEWMLKGDVDRKFADAEEPYGTVDGEDQFPLDAHVNSQIDLKEDDPLAFESADITDGGTVQSGDEAQLIRVLNGLITLPHEQFTFRVVDEPDPGYHVASATITTPNGNVVLTPDNLTSGDYTMSIGEDRLVTVTGQSLTTNDVRFVHALNPPAITLTSGSDDHGSVTEWMLKGDVDRNGLVDGRDAYPMDQEVDGETNLKTDNPLAFESADITSGGTVQSVDESQLIRVLNKLITLPHEQFTFRVVDTPEADYEVVSASITTPKGTVTLTPSTPTSGSYALVIGDGIATVTGQSLATNDVQFTHRKTVLPPPIVGSLTLTKMVTGELGDHNLPFTFEVDFHNTSYNFNAQAYGTITNGTGTITLYHNCSVVFTGLPTNTTYTIKEVGTNSAAYTTTVNNNGTTVNGKEVTGTVAANAAVTVTYTNNLAYFPVVGLNMDVLPFIVLGVMSLGVLGFLILRKRRAR